jgi:hypothetical protein
MIDRLLKIWFANLRNPVGFNYIADHMLKEILDRRRRVGGISFKGHIPEGEEY